MNTNECNKDIGSHPIGPYTTAIQVENLIFISGQISSSIDKNNENNSIILQTKNILKNIKCILKRYNAKVENVIKTTLFITDLEKLNIVNDTYKKFFSKYSNRFPTRSCVEVSKLPQNSLIEIEAIAYKSLT
ncbi:MAG: Rid family detoxifying hydrolase [Buchnera aphidicola (Nurudea shiraii)]